MGVALEPRYRVCPRGSIVRIVLCVCVCVCVRAPRRDLCRPHK